MTNPILDFESGGLPPKARERLERGANGPFTTTFTTAELAVARLAGYEPLGQVMGSSMYHVGWNTSSLAWRAGELDAHSIATREARELALSRMRQEAVLLGAHAVVGVQLSVRDYRWSGQLSEFSAIGTAVRTMGPAPASPALTNLSVQELYKLELAGLWPAGIALGACTWFNPHADCLADGAWFNQELAGHVECLEQARRAATQRFGEDVRALGAHGAVAVQATRRFYEVHSDQGTHTSFRCHVMLLGTAIVRRTAPRVPRPRLVLDLGDRRVDLGPRSEAKLELGRK